MRFITPRLRPAYPLSVGAPSARQLARLAGSLLMILAFLGPLADIARAQSTKTLRAFGQLRYGLTPDQVGLVFNASDPLSVQVAQYYRKARKIPQENVVAVKIPGSPARISPADLESLREEIGRRIPPAVQVLAIAWAQPFAVGCMSITAALAFGYDAAACQDSCAPTRPDMYFDSPSVRPFDDFGFRPSMLLAARDFQHAKALIDRGVAADGRLPAGAAYLLSTSDTARSSRAMTYPQSMDIPSPRLSIRNLQVDSIENRNDVMFYLTGLVHVPKLDTLGFVPGALADHLTSTGGVLVDGSQMSSIRWLEAGATASYGTVSEPCNYPQKFPHAGVLIRHYLAGASAIEAYWKSVAWPAQGVFIGEPLASPYRR